MADFDDLEKIPEIKKEKINAEYRLQVAVINHLTGRVKRGKEFIRSAPAFRGLFVCHLYQGRTKEDGYFLQQLGVVPGVADLLLIWNGDYGFIELKTKTGTLSPAQKKFRGFCMGIGVKYEVARSVQDAHDICVKWGLQPIHSAVKEPDLRTQSEKFAANFAFFERPQE